MALVGSLHIYLVSQLTEISGKIRLLSTKVIAVSSTWHVVYS